MSTEVTPELLRRVLAAWEGGSASDDYARNELHQWAKNLEREQRPLPDVPGWYPGIVVEQGGESCTGALLTSTDMWVTPQKLGGCVTHFFVDRHVTIRWAEQDGKTPGQALREAEDGTTRSWVTATPELHERWERRGAAVLVAHGTPTLTPVGDFPEPGTSGLLWVTLLSDKRWHYYDGYGRYPIFCELDSTLGRTILVDPRPDGAHE